ncbi:hypothetical protein Bca101_079473 [Brassica carinata]
MDRSVYESSTVGGEADSVVAEQGSSRDEDDDWEGVESTELDEAFSAATLFVTTAAADRLSRKPPALKLTARAKWQAWRKLGAMPTEEAMEKYIEIVTQLYPTWLDCGLKAGSRNDALSSSGGTMGPVFSSLVYEEESQNELEGEADREAIAEFLVKQTD